MKPAIIIFLMIVLLILIYKTGWADGFLELYKLSVFSVLVYIFKVLFDDQISKIFNKFFEYIGLKKKEQPQPKYIFNEDAKNSLLHRLKQDVYSLCTKNILQIKKSEINFITDLNWRYYNHSREEFKVRGQLNEVINKTQKFGTKSFAIIGPAGVGKTSAIFDYILHYLEKKDAGTIPVYFSLSSWSQDQTIKDWLQQELDKLYHIDNDPAHYFIASNKIFPFLDGLDQMSQELRESCIMEIYNYARLNPVAITSRPKAFYEIISYLKIKDIDIQDILNVYELHPLSSVQVKEITDKLETKQQFIELFAKSKKLKSFARFPMALYLMSVTIRDITREEIDAIEKSNDLEIFKRLWSKYDQFVLNDEEFLKVRRVKFKPNQIRNWLRSIAIRNEHSFFIEDIQPLYLSSRNMRLNYYLLSRILMAFFISLSVGLFLSGLFEYFNAAILSGFTITMVIYGLRNKKKSPEEQILNISEALAHTSKNKKIMSYVLNILWLLFPLILVLGAYFGFSAPRDSTMEKEMIFNSRFSVTEANAGILIAILMALIFGFRAHWQKIDIDIRSVERLSQNYYGFIKYGFVGGAFLAFSLSVIAFIINTVLKNSGFGIWLQENIYFQNIYLFASLFGFLFGFVLFGIIGYLKENDTFIDKRVKSEYIFKPNFGIRQSAINALKAGVVICVTMTILLGMIIGVLEGEITSIVKAVKTGIAFGILGFLWYGGLDVISHYTLRLLIFLDNSGPLNFIRFLEEASSLRFIRVVGSGYEFTHPTLEHYFQASIFPPLKHQRLKAWIIPFMCITLFTPVFLSLQSRFTHKSFWQDKNGFEIYSFSRYVKKNPNSKDEIIITGLKDSIPIDLEIFAEGKIKIGTFSGYVSPGGTEAGFIGMGIGDLYDYDELKDANHAALAIKKNDEGSWYPFPSKDVYGIFNQSSKLWVRAYNQDRIKFIINDTEWQNNMSHFNIKIDTLKHPCDIEIISHRGAAGLAPENTIEAIKRAISLNVDKIEIDIHQTKDNVIVLMHDKSLNRTTNGRGKIGDINYDEFLSHRIEHNFESISKEIQPPSLEQVLTLIKETNVQLIIEVKKPKNYPNIDSNLNDLIIKHDLTKQVEIFSFDKDFIEKFKRKYPEYRTGIFVLTPFDKINVPGIETIGVYYHSLLLFKSFHRKLSEKGYKVYAWNVNSQRTMQRLIELRVDGIITDRPDRLITIKK